MKKWLTLLLCGVLCFSLMACTETEKEPQSDTPPIDDTEIEEVYVPDKTINRFLIDYKEASGLSLAGLSAGSYEGEYLLPVNLCDVRLSSTDVGICATIEGGRSEQDLERLKMALQILCLVADKSCTRQQLEDTMAWMDQQTETVGNYRVCNQVKVLSYTPLVKIDTVELNCSVSLLLMNYLPIAE